MDAKGIDNYLNMVEECIYTNPLPLLKITNETVIKHINNYLPYSHGMEFECVQKKTYNVEEFKKIPNILDVNVDSSEQRYRIPAGLKGMICLYNISECLKQNSIVDLDSSNHYHTDFTDIINYKNLATTENKEWIIEELKKWETAKDYTYCNNWIRFFNSLGTLEIRIGEPTFEYSVIIKRLIQCDNIARKIKSQISPQHVLRELKKKLAKLNIVESDVNILKNYESIVNTRVIRV